MIKLVKKPFYVVGDGSGAAMQDRFAEDLPSDFIETCQRDLGIIRQDLVSVLQETADVRATLARFASSKPAISRSFFLISGLCFIVIIFFMIAYQQQLHLWLQAAKTIM